MKNLSMLLTGIITLLIFGKSFSQQVAGFDDLSLDQDSYWIANSQGPNDFMSGLAHFSHFYDTTYYSWNGFAYSNIKDTLTAGWMNQYACRPGAGAEGSENYGLFYQWGNDSIWFNDALNLSGFYVSNSTLTALSMQYGDDFAKKFGGETGNDPDWFLLNIITTNEMGNIDTLPFYLADYRFNDNQFDYIIDDWQWIDLSSFGKISKIKFQLTSSDVGDWGMNTPAYFCLDEIKLLESSVENMVSFDNRFSVFPNPAKEMININLVYSRNENTSFAIFNLKGEKVLNGTLLQDKVDVSKLFTGYYFIQLQQNNTIYTSKFVKN